MAVARKVVMAYSAIGIVLLLLIVLAWTGEPEFLGNILESGWEFLF